MEIDVCQLWKKWKNCKTKITVLGVRQPKTEPKVTKQQARATETPSSCLLRATASVHCFTKSYSFTIGVLHSTRAIQKSRLCYSAVMTGVSCFGNTVFLSGLFAPLNKSPLPPESGMKMWNLVVETFLDPLRGLFCFCGIVAHLMRPRKMGGFYILLYIKRQSTPLSESNVGRWVRIRFFRLKVLAFRPQQVGAKRMQAHRNAHKWRALS